MTSNMPFCELSDEEVVSLAQQGNKDALNHIIARYRNFVYHKTQAYFLAGADRDDLFQEGMIGLYEAVCDFDGTKATFRSFASVCVLRQVLTAVKMATRRKHMPLNSYISLEYSADAQEDDVFFELSVSQNPQNPESILIEKENLKAMEQKINQALTKLEQRVLVLYLDGHSYQVIAEKIGKDPKAVDNAVQRIRKKIDRILGVE